MNEVINQTAADWVYREGDDICVMTLPQPESGFDRLWGWQKVHCHWVVTKGSICWGLRAPSSDVCFSHCAVMDDFGYLQPVEVW